MDTSFPAFPGPNTRDANRGLSLRDYLAAAALPAFIAIAHTNPKLVDVGNAALNEWAAAMSYAAADAMLAQRQK